MALKRLRSISNDSNDLYRFMSVYIVLYWLCDSLCSPRFVAVDTLRTCFKISVAPNLCDMATKQLTPRACDY